MNRFLKSTLPVIAAVLMAQTGKAGTTLADLLAPGAQLVNGNLVFYGFQNVTQVGNLNVPLDQIFVDPIWDGPGAVEDEPGIRFTSLQWLLEGPNKQYDLSLDFHVKTADGSVTLEDNTLEITGGAVGSGSAHIAENVIDQSTGNTLANKYVFITSTQSDTQDHKVFTSLSSDIEVSKDFAMSTGDDRDAQIFVSHFDQSFSTVPEPGTIPATLFLISVAVAAGKRHRKG